MGTDLADVCIAGGGAAGMMCAVMAARRGLSVIIVEKNEKLGKKLFICGKGRCNFTNACDSDTLMANVMSNPKFLYGAFHDFSPQDCINFFEKLGLKTKTERGGRVFPVSDRSSDVIKVLEKELARLGVEVILNTRVKDLILTEDSGDISAAPYPGKEPYPSSTQERLRKRYICTGVILEDGGRIEAVNTIIATGGVSYPATGSTGDGFKLAEKAGIEHTPLRPGLVPMEVREKKEKKMQGLSLKNAEVSFFREKGGKLLYKEFGEMLFTHFGVSGPVILSASSVLGDELEKEGLWLEIDLKPALTYEQLDKRLIRELEEGGKKAFKNVLRKLLPSSAVPVFAELVTDDPDRPCNEISKKEREILRNNLKGLGMTVTRLRGFDEAIITRGGVSIKEIDPKTMESKKVKGLYFAGEILDVDALTGGFNLQIAWSTAVRCGRGIEVR